MELQNLMNYVSVACPVVNRLLRNNIGASEYTFDTLFEDGIIPNPLYRFVNNEYVYIQDGIFLEKGYLSCTSDFDSFITKVDGENIACLQFDIPNNFRRIEISDLLPDYNNESEIIPPRGLRFCVEQKQVYSTYGEIQEFLDNVDSISCAKEILEFYGFRTIHYYKLSLV